MDYSYEYEDSDNKYCYPGTDVLRNKLNIQDKDTLHEAERELSMARYFAMEEKGVTGDFSLKHICSIHKELFGDLYEWAGELRTVDISKGTVFCITKFIEKEFVRIFQELKSEDYLKEVDNIEIFAKRLAYYLGEINMVHPFREGNGRTQRMYIEQICKANGRFEINFANASKEAMVSASVKSAICDYAEMEELILRCLSGVKS